MTRVCVMVEFACARRWPNSDFAGLAGSQIGPRRGFEGEGFAGVSLLGVYPRLFCKECGSHWKYVAYGYTENGSVKVIETARVEWGECSLMFSFCRADSGDSSGGCRARTKFGGHEGKIA